MTEPHTIPFNRPFATGQELAALKEALERGHLSADGEFSHRCRRWLEDSLDAPMVLLVHSCTAALELAALLLEVGPGDEVIMPSFTFVTTATAFVMRGAVPVFVDIRPDTLNLDERLVAEAVTSRTRAIVPVHYAGVACEMDALSKLAQRHGLSLIEDAAQGICASYQGRALGTMGALGAISFHETKNVTCGHGGALVVNDRTFMDRAEILRDKGTNRSSFVRGQVDKYTWQDLGSSYALSDLAAAFLWPQLQASSRVTERRRALWSRYHSGLADLAEQGHLRRPVAPSHCHHNAHMYYILLPDRATRDALLGTLDAVGINAVFHYIPLHTSPAGRRYGRTCGDLQVTNDISSCLLRLPLWTSMEDAMVDRVLDELHRCFAISCPPARERSRPPR
ncbi:MAG: dTDP-4-amino-4,6-dideoxygalactose transaminase [Solirubrobacteraceae bacterium]